MRQLRAALIWVTALVTLTTWAHAQEHPEHPSEHPTKSEKSEKAVTTAMLAEAIQDYVAADSKLKGGSFLVYDPVEKKPLQLTLAKVHEDKLATLGGGVYFACADFESTDGTVYDLDIFMKDDDGNLETTDVSIHKVDGQPRYTWREDDGVWRKVEVSKQ